MYINKAMIYGNLTRDPERRALPSGQAVTSFAVATTSVWKDRSGVKKEDTQYHNIVTFGPQADLVAQYLRKGSGVFVEGRMQTRSWDAQDGTKKYRTEIVADRIQFGPKRDGAASTYNQTPAPEAESQAPAKELDTIEYPQEDINPDDIPF
ncbi:MAG: single-stranded DNA-binding protein [Candidatus Vogelbacteria bacterium]|nr:single-stranded DNA-binding protein [Candidatus Vogelbacteria bacterium]